MSVLHALWASLFIHFILVVFIKNWPVTPPDKRNFVEFDVVSQNETRKTDEASKVVRNVYVPEKLKVQETDDKIKFLSEKAQRVKEQTQARLSGITQNQLGDTPGPQKNQRSTARSERSFSEDQGMDVFSPTRKLIPRPGQDSSSSGMSSVERSFDDDHIKIGTMTALNTDQYLFYSFFARTAELVYFRWSTLARSAVDRIQGRQIPSYNTKWVTQVDIWLRPNGEFHSSHLMKASGIPEFDQAAIMAFKQAAFFPNPPKELVEDDGFIHLKYNLQVNYDPKVVVWK